MNEVICYPRCCVPEFYMKKISIILKCFLLQKKKASNVGYVGTQFLRKFVNQKYCQQKLFSILQ